MKSIRFSTDGLKCDAMATVFFFLFVHIKDVSTVSDSGINWLLVIDNPPKHSMIGCVNYKYKDNQFCWIRAKKQPPFPEDDL